MRFHRYPELARLLFFTATVACCQAAHAQTSFTLEAGALHHTLSAGFPSWDNRFVRAIYNDGARDVWLGEIVDAREFGDRGQLFVLANTHTIDDRWYTNVSVTTSNGGFFFPKARADFTANRKWGADRNLVTTAGFTAVNAKDGHADRSVLLALSYYTGGPWVAEGGTRINRSNPGAVHSHSEYLALTYMRDKVRMASLRHAWGNEAYQFIGANALLVNFDSRTTTATWREWLTRDAGLQMRLEDYHNRYYERRGIELSLFHEF